MTASRIGQILKMLEEEPNDSFLNYALAIEKAKIGNLDEAIQIIKKILSHDKNYLGAYYQLGKFQEEANQDQAAIDTYKAGIEIARLQKNNKTENELNEALFHLED